MIAETYPNKCTVPPNRPTQRYFVYPLVMVGGEVNDVYDAFHLRDEFDTGAVLNVGGRPEQYLFATVYGVRILEVPLVDDGNGFALSDVRRALSFAKLQQGRVLYVHCHIGVSRSPAIAYGVLRWVYELNTTDALLALDGSGGEFGMSYLHYAEKHRTYLNSVERAISGQSPFG